MKTEIAEKVIKEFDEFIAGRHYRLLNSVLLCQDDKIVFERYYNKFTKESRNNLKSVWKSIMSVCVGICLDKGMIGSLDEPVANYLPEFDGSHDPYHKMLKIRHLLTMTSGIYWNGGIHYHCPMVRQCARSGNMIEYIADIQMKDVPGTVHVYKEWDVMLASAVLEKAAGMNPYDFCNEYLYQPLHIQSDRWFTTPDGLCYTIPGNNFKGVDGDAEEAKSDLTARDMAKIGYLFLNQGVYEGKRIVSEDYVKQAIAPSECSDEYGMYWWLGEGWYGCRGFGGQEITVFPDKSMIYVTQAKPTSIGKTYFDVLPYLLEKLGR